MCELPVDFELRDTEMLPFFQCLRPRGVCTINPTFFFFCNSLIESDQHSRLSRLPPMHRVKFLFYLYIFGYQCSVVLRVVVCSVSSDPFFNKT